MVLFWLGGSASGLFQSVAGDYCCKLWGAYRRLFLVFLRTPGGYSKQQVVLRLRPKAELFFMSRIWQIPRHVVYGTRMATMTWLGARGSAFGSFALVDGLSCLVLTTFLLSLGFALSASAQIVLVHVRRIEIVLLVTLILFGLIFHLLRKFRRTNPQLGHQLDTPRVTDCAVTSERKM